MSTISSGVGPGRRLAAALAKRDFPAPGGPERRRLWRPAIAMVRARLANDCPLMSSRSGESGGLMEELVMGSGGSFWPFLRPFRHNISSWRESTPTRRILGTRWAWRRF